MGDRVVGLQRHCNRSRHAFMHAFFSFLFFVSLTFTYLHGLNLGRKSSEVDHVGEKNRYGIKLFGNLRSTPCLHESCPVLSCPVIQRFIHPHMYMYIYACVLVQVLTVSPGFSFNCSTMEWGNKFSSKSVTRSCSSFNLRRCWFHTKAR